jgi:hypothetical protein
MTAPIQDGYQLHHLCFIDNIFIINQTHRSPAMSLRALRHFVVVPQTLLELFDLLAEGGLGDMQPLRRPVHM